ncbi:MAG: hypothetical protein K2K66_01850 [Ruminococcus sp.]|nr:hypothetical protein [Ruminococcus sp.]
MYDFKDNELEEKFFQSIENSDIQHIKGSIKRLDGVVINLDESNLLNDIWYDSQCTENEEIFNFGEMYVGSAEIKAILSGENINLIRGGELKLYFKTDAVEKWIPLGVWDIVSAEYKSGNIFSIKGYDHLNRLNAPITDDTIGAIFMKSVLRQVSKDAGVEFAQTIEEIQQVAGSSVDIINGSWATHFLDTCWNEVKAIAQFLGCFAFANREGKIEFRRFGTNSVMTIPAEKRFSAKISDYQYSVKGISYTDEFGQTVPHVNDEGTCVLGFSENKYIWGTRKNPDTAYGDVLKRIAYAVGCYSNQSIRNTWTPGTIEYYGNPALDVGDMIKFSSKINDRNVTLKFLITHITWRFRGSQTLISGGVPESVATISGSSGGASVGTVTSYTTINSVNNISVIELKKYTGEVFSTERFVAKTGFSSTRETWIFLDCTFILSGNGLVSASIWLNGIAQTLRPKITLHDGEFSTLHFSFTTKISGGRHNIQIGVRGNADISDIHAFLWGQEVSEESPEITSDNDYIYTKNNGDTIVRAYIGKSVFPSIPDDLGGGKTKIIEKNSFSESEIEKVYIPDGVTTIR